MGRTSYYQKDRQTKAKERLKHLFETLAKRGISQGKVARMIYERRTDPYKDVNAIRQDLSKYKNIKSVREDGLYQYPFSEDSAIEICDAINKYLHDSDIHAGSDIRWRWLAGIDDDYPTYNEEFYGEYHKELAKEENQIRIVWEEAPRRLLEYALDLEGLQLVESIDSFGWIQDIRIKGIEENEIVLSVEDVHKIEDDLRSYSTFLVSRLVKEKT